jgi:hypothetical protein
MLLRNLGYNAETSVIGWLFGSCLKNTWQACSYPRSPAQLRIDGGGLWPYAAAHGKLLGHTKSATTERYAHLADDPLRAANDRIGEELTKALG